MTIINHDPNGIYIRLPIAHSDAGIGYKTIANDVVEVLRGKISGHLHNLILKELLMQECNGSALRAGLTVRELIERL